MKLTEGQERELRYMLVGPQHTYGSGRARIQNALVAKGLARFASVPDGADFCVITNEGRAALTGSADSKGGNG